MEKRLTYLGIAYCLATAIIYGAYPPANRAVYADGGNDIFILVVVSWTRALSMMLYCIAAKKPIFQTRSDLRQAIIGGFFQTLTMIGVASSLVFLQGPIVSIIVYTYALMLLFYTSMRGETKLTFATFLTTLAAFGGLTLVLDVWKNPLTLSCIGISLAFMAALTTASRIYVFGTQTRQRDPMIVGAECLMFTALFCTLTVFFKTPHVPISSVGYGWAFIACLSASVGSFTMFHGISLLGAFRWGLFSKIEPIFTSLFSIWFLGEILKWQQYLGILVVIISLVVYQLFEQRRER